MLGIKGLIAAFIVALSNRIIPITGAIMNKRIFERSLLLENHDTSNTPLATSAAVANLGECAKLCFDKPLCGYQSLYDGVCSLYRYSPQSAAETQGMIYFSSYGDDCPISQGYISVYSPRLCFKLSEVSDTMTWSNAQTRCQSEGGRLIILNTESKFDFIDQYMYDQDPGNAFVGMDKVGSTFKWTDGTDYVKQWGDVEPDYVSYQNCVAIWKSDGLGDIECNNARRYLCEIQVSG